MSYLEAPQTKLLATHCCVCGRALCDAISVECGIGPVCRQQYVPECFDEQARRLMNQLTHAAALYARQGRVPEVLQCAAAIRAAGFTELAEKVAERFVVAANKVKLTITEHEDILVVTTPFRRGDKQAFVNAWRAIPGRRWNGTGNEVPLSSRTQLWDLLCKFFPGVFGQGPRGLFRVPEIVEGADK